MVAENYHLRVGGFFVWFVEDAAVAGLNAEGVEKTCGDHRAFDLNGLVVAGEIEKRIAYGHGAVIFEGVLLRTIVQEVGRGNSAVIAERAIPPGPYEARRIFERERAQQDGVHDAEDGGVGADAEGKSEDGDGREAGRFRERADGIFQVLQN